MATWGKGIIILSNIFYSAGSFFMDWSVTHIYNPRWPPHAKFHNGQTMSLGVLLATGSAYYALRPTSSTKEAKDSMLTAALLASMYTIAGVSAVWYPGSLATDPEFGTGMPQVYAFAMQVLIVWLGYWLELRRINKAKMA